MTAVLFWIEAHPLIDRRSNQFYRSWEAITGKRIMLPARVQPLVLRRETPRSPRRIEHVVQVVDTIFIVLSCVLIGIVIMVAIAQAILAPSPAW